MTKKILLSSPHMSGEELAYVKEAFETNWIAPLGPNVDQFEKDIVQYSESKAALATISGTAAIHLALAVLDVGKGDIIFCSSFTFVASANPALYLGAEVEFIDSEWDTWNMSPIALERALQHAEQKGKLPKAIIVVHLYGQSAKMDELLSIASRYNIPIIEDAAESLGSEYKGKKSGTLGKLGIYSFNGNKIITTSGGGALVSNDPELIQRARHLATQAKEPAHYYFHQFIGYNYRMSNLLAGVGRAQLNVLDDRVRRRREIFHIYKQEFSLIPGLAFMPELDDTYSNRWLTTLTFDPTVHSIHPFNIMHQMKQVGIETRAFWNPLHLQPLYQNVPIHKHQLNKPSVCQQLFSRGLCLPSGSNLTEQEQLYVIEQLKQILLSSKRKASHHFSSLPSPAEAVKPAL